MMLGRLGAAKPWLLLACALGAFLAAPVHAENTTYTYDALGRLLRAENSDGKTVAYNYDRPGNRTLVGNGANGREIAPLGFSASSNSHGYSGLTTPNAMRDGVFNLMASIHATNADVQSWIMADLGSAQALDHVDLAPPDDQAGTFTPQGALMLSGATLEFSQDGASWTAAGVVGAAASGTYTPMALGGVSARYVRIRKSGAWVALGDMRFYAQSNGPNSPPVANDDTSTVASRSYVDIYPLANDNDPDGDPRVISAVTPPPHGTATIQANGGYVTYGALDPHTPIDFQTGIDQFSYTITDGRNGSATAQIRVTVTPAVNHNPILRASGWGTVQNQPIEFDLAPYSTDQDGDTLTITTAFNGDHGRVDTLGQQRLRYTPTQEDFTGSDAFTYYVSDGHGGTAQSTVSVIISNGNSTPNQAPVARPDTVTTTVGAAVILDPRRNDYDPDGDFLTITAASTNTAGASVVVSPGGDGVTFTPAPGFVGPDTFTYTIADGRGGTAQATVGATMVSTTNHNPTAEADNGIHTSSGVAVTIDPRANDSDPDGDGLTILSVTQPAHGSAGYYIGGSLITYRSADDFVGTDTFRYTISDGRGGTASADVAIVVTSTANHLPSPKDDWIWTPMNQAITFSPLGNDIDVDIDPLTVIAIGQGEHGVVTKVGQTIANQLTYTPNPGFTGEDSFLYMAEDGHSLGFASATVHVTVGGPGPNQNPQPQNDNYSVPSGSQATLDVRLNDHDPEGQSLTIIDAGPAEKGTVTFSGGLNVVYKSNSGSMGEDHFNYTVFDGHGGQAIASVQITLTTSAPPAPNEAPQPQSDDYAITYHTPTVLSVRGNDNDPDNDVLTITDVTQGAHGGVVINDGATVTYTPDQAFLGGTDGFDYTVSDGHGHTAVAHVGLTVAAPPNHNPVGVNDNYTVADTLWLNVLSNDGDPDGDAIFVDTVNSPSHGIAFPNAGGIAYLANMGYVGQDSFFYHISDGRGGLGEAYVTINVTGPAPTYTCWDGSTVSNPAYCPDEPPEPTYTCWDGSTVSNLAYCPAVPPTYSCWDGSTVSNPAYCPAQPTYTCWNGLVVGNLANCPPEPPPGYQCWNGATVSNPALCPSQPPPEYQCWNGMIVSDLAYCPVQCVPSPGSHCEEALLEIPRLHQRRRYGPEAPATPLALALAYLPWEDRRAA